MNLARKARAQLGVFGVGLYLTLDSCSKARAQLGVFGVGLYLTLNSFSRHLANLNTAKCLVIE